MANFWERILKSLGLLSEPEEKAPDKEEAPRKPRQEPSPGQRDLDAWRGESAPQPAPARPPELENPYLNREILQLSDEEWAEKSASLGTVVWRDLGADRSLIPPQTDLRTALIDRGMVLRGFLTEAELVEMHRVGDAWLLAAPSGWPARIFGESYLSAWRRRTLSEALITQRAEEAVAALREERAARKARLRAEAEEKRQRRAREIAARRETDIVFAGRGVSSRLCDRRADIERLQAAGLPVLCTPADLAAFLEISVPELRWLAFYSEAAARPHYVRFTVPKRSGGERVLSSPMPKLAAVQQRILRGILDLLPTEEPAHGFIRGRSTVTGARPHVGKDVLVKLDLVDFFPTITFPRVRGLFETLGYSPAVATLLALLCTESPREIAEYAGERYFVAVGPPACPQGASTSPAISNRVCRALDRRLSGMALQKGWTYTRYADDLTFSAPPGHQPEIGWLLAQARRLIETEGFVLHPEKIRVLRRGGRQSVTGVGVNDKPGLRRSEVRQLRALLHNARTTGLAAQNREGREGFEAWLRGKLAYLAMVDPEKGLPMLAELDTLLGASSS